MADFSWTPPIVALATGAIGGVLVVIARGRTRPNRPADNASPMPPVSVDLQRRYDALIRRLAEGVESEERSAIEVQAAVVLREMETGAESISTESMGVADRAAVRPLTTARQTPAWLGFLYGIATMGVLGGLVYLASTGAAERKEGGSPTGGNAMGSAASARRGADADPVVGVDADASELRRLEDAVRKTPKDLSLRIELSRAYLHRRDLMKVFDQTKAALEIEPGNPQALTYQALVRVAMGQAAQAETMLNEAIRKDPQIEDAYIHMALARIQQGNKKGAEQAIQEAQKRFPEDKAQLAQVFTQISSTSKEDGAVVPLQHPGPDSAAPPATKQGSPGVSVVVDLPKGVRVPASAVLFVIVREAGFETGPPIAVKRVPATFFPITVTLTDKDSMAGESLPGLIRIDARVDRDGDPLTKDPRDPVASEDNVRPGTGQVFLVLSGKPQGDSK